MRLLLDTHVLLWFLREPQTFASGFGRDRFRKRGHPGLANGPHGCDLACEPPPGSKNRMNRIYRIENPFASAPTILSILFILFQSQGHNP